MVRGTRVTARDVARAAGVSQATVSFVLNDRADQTISETTKRAVLAAVDRLGYVPSGAARSLRTGRSSVVLCLIPDIVVAQAMEEFRRTLSRVLAEAGMTCVFLHVEPGMRLGELWPHVHPAIVLSFGSLPTADADRIRRAGIPLVDDLLGPGGVGFTGLDQADVGGLQVRHLAGRGHTRIGFAAVEDPREEVFLTPRQRGVEEACRELGLPAPLVLPVGYSSASGAGAVRRWLGDGVTAVAGFNDLAALSVLAGAVDLGHDVPGDLAVIGVDDLPAAALSSPGLTTIAFDTTVTATMIAVGALVEAGLPEAAEAVPGADRSPIRLVGRESA